MKVKSESEVTQSCPTLSDPMDCSLPGSSIHGILQAKVLEWGAVAFSDLLLLIRVKNFLLSRFVHHKVTNGFPGGIVVKNLPANAGDARNTGLIPWSGRSPGVGNSNPLHYFLPGKFHRQKNLAGYKSMGSQESDTTDHRHTHKLQTQHEMFPGRLTEKTVSHTIQPSHGNKKNPVLFKDQNKLHRFLFK